MCKRRHGLVLALLIITCAALISCGGGGSGGGSTEAEGQSTTNPTTNNQAQADADTTPDYVNFGGAIVPMVTTVTSWIAKVTGINVPVDFVVNSISKSYSSPQYRIDGGAWTAVVIGKAVQVSEGQTLQLKVTTPPIPNFDTIVWDISVGDGKTNWQVAAQ